MAISYYKNCFRGIERFTLLAFLCLAFFLIGSGTVFAGNSGFFFEAGVDYYFEPFQEPDEGRKTFASIGGHGAMGCTFGQWDFSLESGYAPRSYKNENGDIINFTQIPGVFKIGYNTIGEHGLSVKPEISGGIIFGIPESGSFSTPTTTGTETPGTPTTLNIDYTAGVGLNFVYTFPGDHVTFFAGAVYNFYLPRDDLSSYTSLLQAQGGIIIHPFKSLDEY